MHVTWWFPLFSWAVFPKKVQLYYFKDVICAFVPNQVKENRKIGKVKLGADCNKTRL